MILMLDLSCQLSSVQRNITQFLRLSVYVRGHYAGVQAQLPAPVGFEGVGIVDSLGPQVQGYVAGQSVAVRYSRGGATGRIAVVRAGESFLLPVPEETKNEQWFQHEPCWFVRKKNAPWYGKAGENSTIWASLSPKFITGAATSRNSIITPKSRSS